MGIQIFIMMSSERGALRKIMLGFPQKQTQSTSLQRFMQSFRFGPK